LSRAALLAACLLLASCGPSGYVDGFTDGYRAGRDDGKADAAREIALAIRAQNHNRQLVMRKALP
jgi:hypothetical protein